MAFRNILLDGDEVLRKKSRPVTDFGARTAGLMDDLRETLTRAAGAGLAAPQVGILRRAAVIVRDGEMVELINPGIAARSDEETGKFEGCLSCPGEWGYLKRPDRVTVKAQNRAGEWFELECEGIAARSACHEIDHLDGVLFKDFVDELLSEEDVEELLELAENESLSLDELMEIIKEAGEETIEDFGKSGN
jgi:peptide deformylase